MRRASNSFSFRHRKLKVFQIYDPVYRVNWVYCACPKFEDYAEMRKACFNLDKKSVRERENFAECIYAYNSKQGNIVFIWVKEHVTATITHEVMHGVEAVMRDCGIELTEKTSEAYAYYIEFIVHEIVEVYLGAVLRKDR